MEYDIFISHASEDKDSIARPLASMLLAKGYKSWFGEMTLTLDYSLRLEINKGLASSKFGIVILSQNFLKRNWSGYELNSLVQIELDHREKYILPIWHKIDKPTVMEYSASLANKIADVVGPPSYDPSNTVTVSPHITGSKCPSCGQTGEHFGFEENDDDEALWFECFKCGYLQGFE